MPTPTLSAADYSDWLQYSGLYFLNVSHADRYRTFQAKISPAGLAAKIVFDFLRSNRGGIDLQMWRNSDVYEMAPDAAYRVEETARSLEAIGAPRVAAKMRAVKNTSIGAMLMEGGNDPAEIMKRMQGLDPVKLMQEFQTNVGRLMPGAPAAAGLPASGPIPPDPEIESKEQIEHLLNQYVHAHADLLRADMAKHGDPRTKPGFTPENREAEIDALRRAHYDRENQAEQVGKMESVMREFENLVAKNPKIKPGKVGKHRRAILQCYRDHVRRPEAELVPEMRKWLKEAERFQETHSSLFRLQAIDDAELLRRLKSFGPHEVDVGNKKVRVTWNAPECLACDWSVFSLTLDFPIGDKKALALLLDAYGRLVKNFAQHQAELRKELLDHFNMYYEHLDSMGILDDYERDAAGKPTEQSILKHAGNGSIHMSLADPESSDVILQVHFGIEWDEEHGFETTIIDDPEVKPAEQAAALTNVTFHESGPPITNEDLSKFEKEHDVKLPADYRSLLLQHNGGRPEPNHVKLASEGGPGMPVYIDRLFSLDELGDAIDLHRANDLPANYAPIGKARMPGPTGNHTVCDLVLGLSGKKQGKLLTYMSMIDMMPPDALTAMPPEFDPAQMAGMYAGMYEQMCQQIAPNLAALLSRLTPPPGQGVPAWLKAIRAGDVGGFLAAKVKLSEQYVPYGAIHIQTVLDYLALEAKPAFLLELIQKSVVKPHQLRASWQRWSNKIARFKELMPLFAKDERCFAFSATDVWNDSEMLEQLASDKKNLEAPVGPEGETPLHLAVNQGRPDAVRWLFAQGASPKTPDQYGRTALIWAESTRQLECVIMLLDAGESLESLFPHMPTWKDKLRLLKSRWNVQFDALADYLRSKGLSVEV